MNSANTSALVKDHPVTKIPITPEDVLEALGS